MTQGDDCLHNDCIVRIGGQVSHERAINLELVDWETFQIAKTGIAGAKIVDGNLHPKRLNLHQHTHIFFGTMHGQTFGELNLQVTCLETGDSQGFGNHLNHTALAKLPRRYVD